MKQRAMTHTMYALLLLVIFSVFLTIGAERVFAQATDRFERSDSRREVSDRDRDPQERSMRGDGRVFSERHRGERMPSRNVGDAICERISRLGERVGTNIPLPPFCEEEEPPVDMGHVVINEVYYDVDGDRGAENSNEWIELYNPTDAAVDVGGWSIGDSSSGTLLPGGTSIPAGGVIIVTNEEGLDVLWPEIPESAPIIALGVALNTGGLSNSGDALFLRNPSAELIDSVSWGTNTDAFDPSVEDADPGSSIERTEPGVDTDTAADWTENTEPTPGIPGVLQQN